MRRKRRSGINLLSGARAKYRRGRAVWRRDGLAATGALVLLLSCVPPAAGAKKKAVPQSYATVAGTIFDQRGYALPSADVALIPDLAGENARVKTKKLQAISDSRGEFAFHVPPGAMQYTVKVAAKGYQSSQKSVSVQGEERVDVTFQLEPESK